MNGIFIDLEEWSGDILAVNIFSITYIRNGKHGRCAHGVSAEVVMGDSIFRVKESRRQVLDKVNETLMSLPNTVSVLANKICS